MNDLPMPDAGGAVTTLLPSAPPLRLATRGSALALAQSRMIGEQLAGLTGRTLELVEVTTQGDVDPGSLATIGGAGVFVAAVREALADDRADVAVHSLKDLPTAPDPRLRLAAVPPREDPRDALIARAGGALADLPRGARVGTGSPRRRAQLAAARPDLDLRDLRGNVDTRIARVDGDPARGIEADLDAVVLATAGLRRLGRQSRISAVLPVEEMLPAPGQGALAVEARAAAGVDQAAAALDAALAALDDAVTRACVTAERSLLAALEAGCAAPVGALAEVDHASGLLRLRGVLATDAGLIRAGAHGSIDDPEALGRQLANELLETAGTSTTTNVQETSETSETSTTRMTRSTLPDPSPDASGHVLPAAGSPTHRGSPTP